LSVEGVHFIGKSAAIKRERVRSGDSEGYQLKSITETAVTTRKCPETTNPKESGGDPGTGKAVLPKERGRAARLQKSQLTEHLGVGHCAQAREKEALKRKNLRKPEAKVRQKEGDCARRPNIGPGKA